MSTCWVQRGDVLCVRVAVAQACESGGRWTRGEPRRRRVAVRSCVRRRVHVVASTTVMSGSRCRCARPLCAPAGGATRVNAVGRSKRLQRVRRSPLTLACVCWRGLRRPRVVRRWATAVHTRRRERAARVGRRRRWCPGVSGRPSQTGLRCVRRWPPVDATPPHPVIHIHNCVWRCGRA